MNLNPKTPMALYKANLELVLRIGALLQENRQRWMKAGAAGTSEAIQRTLAETERMLTTNDWTALSKMPGEEFWKSLRGEAGPLQANAESAVRSQADFAEGLKQAFAEWQQQSMAALGGSATPPAPWAFPDLTQNFHAAGRDQPATQKPKPRPTPKPAAKKATAAKSKASVSTPKAKAKTKTKTATVAKAKVKSSAKQNPRASGKRQTAKK